MKGILTSKYLLILLVSIVLVGIRAGEYIAGHFLGDKDGKIVMPFLSKSLAITYRVLFVLLAILVIVCLSSWVKRPRPKTVFFTFIMIIIGWMLIELITQGGYFLTQHTMLSTRDIKKKMQASLTFQENSSAAEGNLEYAWDFNNLVEVIHPYIGFVLHPGRNGNLAVSDFGFVSGKQTHPILKRSPDTRIVGLCGGSFAVGAYTATQSLLQECLKSPGKDVIVLNFSAPGYKQPQQLLILAYLLALGAEFDVIINLDGFNEIALPPYENIPHQVYPFFPRSWHARTRNIIDPVTIKRLGHIEVLQEDKARWARLFYEYKLYFSPALCIVWQYRDQMIDWSIYKLRQAIQQDVKSETYVSQGPQYVYQSDQQFYADLVRVWQQCSFQMQKLCDANGIEYYHFLQPNQYLEGSKPMTGKEQKIALQANHPYKIPVSYFYFVNLGITV